MAMCPWPLSATVSIQNPRGFVEEGSHKVPACLSEGAVVRLSNSYQREPFLGLVDVATHRSLTPMLCAAQRVEAPLILLLWIVAANNRSSKASSLLLGLDPSTTWRTGDLVAGMPVGVKFPDIEGTPPGFVTRRIWMVLKVRVSTPMKYPSVAAGSSLETPLGAKGPAMAAEASWRSAGSARA